MTDLKNRALALMWAGLVLLAPPLARAADESDLLPVDQAYVLQASAPTRDRIELNWAIAPGYYLYRHRFAVEVLDPKFGASGAPTLPDGDKHHDEFFGDVETYRGAVTAVQLGAADPGLAQVKLKVRYQGCADLGVCYPPQTRTLTVDLPAAADAPAAFDPLASLGGPAIRAPGEALPEAEAFRFEAIANTPGELLVRLTPAPGYYLYRDKTTFTLDGADGAQLAAPHFPPTRSHRDEHFGEVAVWFDQAEIPVGVARRDAAAQTLTLRASFQGCQDDGICYPPMSRTLQVALPAGAGIASLAGAATTGTTATVAAAAEDDDAGPGLWLSLLLALAGGLILNLMPCVLPVLSFKALGLAQASRSHAHARAHALWYTAGVLVAFAAVGALVLALRGAGQALGWGFQLQQPAVVGTLSLLMFAIGLNLSGLFEIGSSWTGLGQGLTERSGAAGDFFTGVLAVVVASPCTAPFMAGALGYAFVAPVAGAMAVFLALGLGLALPFLLIGFVPGLASRLPRPGAWMDTVKHWLALPMYLTAVWLAWVFGKQRGVDGLAVLLVACVLLALGLWWWQKQQFKERATVSRGVALVMMALAIGGLVVATRVASPAARATAAASGAPREDGSQAWSPQALAAARAAGKPVFVDMTADWCITCKVNEKAVLHTDAFRALLQRTGAVYLVGDWTDQDPQISAYLDEFRSPGVPLYVVYPAGGGPGRKLPQLLTPGLMQQALEGPAAK